MQNNSDRWPLLCIIGIMVIVVFTPSKPLQIILEKELPKESVEIKKENFEVSNVELENFDNACESISIEKVVIAAETLGPHQISGELELFMDISTTDIPCVINSSAATPNFKTTDSSFERTREIERVLQNVRSHVDANCKNKDEAEIIYQGYKEVIFMASEQVPYKPQ